MGAKSKFAANGCDINSLNEHGTKTRAGQIARTVTVTSDPPGAMIWKKEGTALACTGIRTPGTVELKFHGASDVQKIRLRRFGYNGKNLDIRPGDDRVNAALGAAAPDSFLVPDNAGPDLRELNAGLKKEFEGTLFADPEALPVRALRVELCPRIGG